MAFLVEGHAPDRSEFFPCGVPRQSPQVAGVGFFGVEPIRSGGLALFCGSPSGTRAAEEDVFGGRRPRGPRHGVLIAFQFCDGANCGRLPHDAGVGACRPSAVQTAPRPALNKLSSSRREMVATTASTAPPASRTAPPCSSADWRADR